MKNITLMIMILLISCSTKDNEKDIKRHKDLIHYKSPFLAELGDENYDKLSTKIKKDKINIDYFKDIIYVDYLTEVNACGNYFGNIEISNDTKLVSHRKSPDSIELIWFPQRIKIFSLASPAKSPLSREEI